MAQVTGREDARHHRRRWVLMDVLRTVCASPEDAADALLTDIFEYGGALSIAGDHVKPDGRHRVLLRLHGLTVGGECVEEAAINWLNSARASLSGEIL